MEVAERLAATEQEVTSSAEATATPADDSEPGSGGGGSSKQPKSKRLRKEGPDMKGIPMPAKVDGPLRTAG